MLNGKCQETCVIFGINNPTYSNAISLVPEQINK